ncbi:hypothetical protein [Actinoplanes philippinensis]|uniref:hypothetical protein n=1 Tax=Actinoplanes philippinensis TaxID=35752 RepID=UPI0033EEA0D5
MREFGAARADFYRAARPDLGITGDLPRAGTPQWNAALAERPERPERPVAPAPAVTGRDRRRYGGRSRRRRAP